MIALKVNGGIIMASNTLARYGSSLYHEDVSKLQNLSDNILVGSSGDYSDYQELMRLLNEKWHQ